MAIIDSTTSTRRIGLKIHTPKGSGLGLRISSGDLRETYLNSLLPSAPCSNKPSEWGFSEPRLERALREARRQEGCRRQIGWIALDLVGFGNHPCLRKVPCIPAFWIPLSRCPRTRKRRTSITTTRLLVASHIPRRTTISPRRADEEPHALQQGKRDPDAFRARRRPRTGRIEKEMNSLPVQHELLFHARPRLWLGELVS